MDPRSPAKKKPEVKREAERPAEPPRPLPIPELGTVWAEGWMCEGWPPSTPDPRWLR